MVFVTRFPSISLSSSIALDPFYFCLAPSLPWILQHGLTTIVWAFAELQLLVIPVIPFPRRCKFSVNSVVSR